MLLVLLLASLILLRCYNANTNTTGTGGNLKDRAFFTENVSSGTVTAGVYVVDAQHDLRPSVAPIAAGIAPGLMVLTPSRTQTLVFSSTENQLTVIINASQSAAGQITLPGFTESFVVSPDGSTAYAAVPTASVVGQSPGAVKVVSLSSIAFTAEIDIPAVRFLAISNTGNRILAFSDNSDAVSVITPSKIVTGNAVTSVGGFDRPVAAFFSPDDTTAFVVNCGAECGGTQASVQTLDLTSNSAGAAVNVPAATVAVVNGTTMYLAGTPFASAGGSLVPSLPCSTGQNATRAEFCGQLSIFDLATMSLVDPATTIVITDGYHNRMALGANGQLFIGARTCAEVTAVNTGDEVRGCLSIYNTPTGAVVIPPANGEVTGIQPIAQRAVVYVVQGGSLGIYDARTDKLQTTQITTLVGQFVDVKTVDF
ncbi:MAG TPA: hypothetical protein VEK84_12095 [Terriglobales bacterium]|nr:hypothetical protein [Terriglobales bacterium]